MLRMTMFQMTVIQMSNLFKQALRKIENQTNAEKKPMTFAQFKKRRQKNHCRKPGWPESGYKTHQQAYKEYLDNFQNFQNKHQKIL